MRRGFARNYLIPSKQAVYNTETNKALFKEEKNVAGQADGDQIHWLSHSEIYIYIYIYMRTWLAGYSNIYQ